MTSSNTEIIIVSNGNATTALVNGKSITGRTRLLEFYHMGGEDAVFQFYPQVTIGEESDPFSSEERF